MAEIQYADPRTRRIALLYVVVGAALGFGALLIFERYRQSLLSWMVETPPETQVGIICLAFLALCLPLLLFAVWMWTYGVRVLRENRHPPKEAKLVRDTPVTHGAAARRYGRLYQSLAALFMLAAVFLVGFAWKLWRLM